MTTPNHQQLAQALRHANNHDANPGIVVHTHDWRLARSLVAILGLTQDDCTVFQKVTDDDPPTFRVYSRGNTKIFVSNPLTNLSSRENPGSSRIEDVIHNV